MSLHGCWALPSRVSRTSETLCFNDDELGHPVPDDQLAHGITPAILRGVSKVFDDFRFVREIRDVGGRDHAMLFEAKLVG
jgi:hypothetical protein